MPNIADAAAVESQTVRSRRRKRLGIADLEAYLQIGYRLTSFPLSVLGKMIRHGRKQRRMTEVEFAERLGIARSTLQRLEKGDPKVEASIHSSLTFI
jgi:DNA-binding XRE family transcriptional regulator